MKKIISLLLVLSVLLVLFGCGSKNTGEETTEKTYLNELITGDNKTVIVATCPDYPPFENINVTTGELEGFDIDLINILMEKIGLEVDWVDMGFDTIVSAIQAGTIDVGASGFSYDPEKQVLFSDNYFDAGQVVLIQKESGYKTLNDLEGKTIACQLGTTMCEAVEENIKDAKIEKAENTKLLVEALKQGQYDGLALDTIVAEEFAKNNDDLVILDETLVSDAYALIVNYDHPLLIDELNKALKDFMASDEYTALLTKWGMN